MISESTSQLMTMLELECSAINILFESRPRTKAMKFGVDVGGLYLRDKFLENSIFPNVIAPQPKVTYIISWCVVSKMSSVWLISKYKISM